jgi:hypothetical protein
MAILTEPLPLNSRQRHRGVIAAYPRTAGGYESAVIHAGQIGGRVTHARDCWTVQGPTTQPLMLTDAPPPATEPELRRYLRTALDRRWRARRRGDLATAECMQERINQARARLLELRGRHVR